MPWFTGDDGHAVHHADGVVLGLVAHDQFVVGVEVLRVGHMETCLFLDLASQAVQQVLAEVQASSGQRPLTGGRFIWAHAAEKDAAGTVKDHAVTGDPGDLETIRHKRESIPGVSIAADRVDCPDR